MKRVIFFPFILLGFHMVCSANATSRGTWAARPADSTLKPLVNPAQLLNEILAVTGLTANFELKAASVNNIEASIVHRKRLILYNQEFVTRLTETTGSKWAVATLLAHEIGHHLNGHTISREGSSPSVELEADAFAGFVLYNLGATLSESQQVMYLIAKTEASKTHPARKSRLSAVEAGWNRAATKKVK